MAPKPDFSIIGCGRVGIALAVFLSRAGYRPAGFFSKSAGSAQKACDTAGAGKVAESAVQAAAMAKVVFISTPDQAIESVCEDLAEHPEKMQGITVFHLSGALSSDILISARQAGASAGSIHPLQSFAPFQGGQSSPFSGINMSIEGDDLAVELGKTIVRDLEARYFCIPTPAKTLYHAAAVVASNYLVTLEHFALELLNQADLSPEKAFEILEPLIWGTLNNIKSQGTINALTGPVARGDATVVGNHLRDIDKAMPDFKTLYRVLGQHTLEIARKRGEIDPKAAADLARLFEEEPS